MEFVAEYPSRRWPQIPSLVWLLGTPFVAGLVWLGLLLALQTANPLEVTIGRSMEPTLRTGDLAIMRGITPAQLKLGDVVAITVNQSDRDQYGYPERVLHRVIGLTLKDNALVVQTKGDNEAQPDPFVVPASQISRRLDFHVPFVGYALFYLRSTQGRIALGGLLVLFLLYEGVRWMTDTAEELVEEPAPYEGFALGLQQLAGAVTEYGEHLRSHTRVVRELGGTTEDLHSATSLQREVLQDLSLAVRALAQGSSTQGIAMSGSAIRGNSAALQAPSVRPVPLIAPVAPPVFPDRPTFRLDPLARGALPDAAPGVEVELIRAAVPDVSLSVRGLPGERALLEFGLLLESMPAVTRVALDEVDATGARFTVETFAVDALMRDLWWRYRTGTSAAGASA